ncbi:MAG: alanine racemase C-terminal domain-containing protein [Eubacteriales bacterium]
MDVTTNIPEAEVEWRVTIFGKDGENTITVDELASFNSTIHYEMVCLVGKRVAQNLLCVMGNKSGSSIIFVRNLFKV